MSPRSKFFASLEPIAKPCRFVGLQSPSVDYYLPRPIHADHAYIAFYCTIQLFISIYTLYYLHYNPQTQNIVPKEILLCMASAAQIQTTFVLIVGFKFRRIFTRALRQVVLVDEVLSNFGILVDYSRNYWRNCANLLILVVSIGSRVVFSAKTVNLDFIQKLGLVAAVSLMSLVKFQFVAVVDSTADRFRAINRHVGEAIAELSKLHFRLCHSLRLLNACFGLQLATSVFCSFCMILFQLFFAYTLLTKRSHVVTSYTVSTPFFYLTAEIVEIYRLVNSCAKAKENAERTPILIHEIRSKCGYSRGEDQTVYSRSVEMLHQKIDFVPLGIFKMDYYLIYQIFMAASAYAIIYIQYDLSDKDS